MEKKKNIQCTQGDGGGARKGRAEVLRELRKPETV